MTDTHIETETRLSVDDIWKILDGVPDPEIPVISLVDLGIIRDVSWHGNTLVVALTPTYSGCPATGVINLDIEAALRARGVCNIELKRQLSPPWTTQWMSEKGKDKLRAYGIAPPDSGAICGTLDPSSSGIACPRCSATNTTRVSQFGSTPCKASYKCNDCLEPFDYFKCI